MTQLAWELSDVSKLDYAHYTLKEIHEQPETVVSGHDAGPEETGRLRGRHPRRQIGSAYGIRLELPRSPPPEEPAEPRGKDQVRRRDRGGVRGSTAHFVDESTVIVAFSQSGETADLLEAVKIGKQKGAKVFAVVNAAGSSLARESDAVLLLNCGPEVGVAATKSFTAQVMVGNMIADAVIGRDTVERPGEGLCRGRTGPPARGTKYVKSQSSSAKGQTSTSSPAGLTIRWRRKEPSS